jgi:hypothetical protein
MQRLSDLTSRVEKLERGPTNATQTVFHNSQGDVLMRAGTDPDSGEKGFTVGRTDGKPVIEVKAAPGQDTQNIKLYDRAGNMILGDSETFESGLRRPSISAMVNNVGLVPPAQTTFIYTTVADAYFRKSNPAIEVVLNYWSSDGATAIQLRFRELDTFTVLGGLNAPYEPIFNPAPIGANAARLVTPPLVLPDSRFPIGEQIHLIVEAQKISGAGTFTVHTLAVRGSDDV